MATKKKSEKEPQATVVRVKATDTRESKKTKEVTPKVQKATASPAPVTKEKKERKNPLKATGGYFKGAWEELRQVRWPNRKATWSMTAALLVFTAFFVALILLLDALFKYMFQLILGN